MASTNEHASKQDQGLEAKVGNLTLEEKEKTVYLGFDKQIRPVVVYANLPTKSVHVEEDVESAKKSVQKYAQTLLEYEPLKQIDSSSFVPIPLSMNWGRWIRSKAFQMRLNIPPKQFIAVDPTCKEEEAELQKRHTQDVGLFDKIFEGDMVHNVMTIGSRGGFVFYYLEKWQDLPIILVDNKQGKDSSFTERFAACIQMQMTTCKGGAVCCFPNTTVSFANHQLKIETKKGPLSHDLTGCLMFAYIDITDFFKLANVKYDPVVKNQHRYKPIEGRKYRAGTEFYDADADEHGHPRSDAESHKTEAKAESPAPKAVDADGFSTQQKTRGSRGGRGGARGGRGSRGGRGGARGADGWSYQKNHVLSPVKQEEDEEEEEKSSQDYIPIASNNRFGLSIDDFGDDN